MQRAERKSAGWKGREQEGGGREGRGLRRSELKRHQEPASSCFALFFLIELTPFFRSLLQDGLFEVDVKEMKVRTHFSPSFVEDARGFAKLVLHIDLD